MLGDIGIGLLVGAVIVIYVGIFLGGLYLLTSRDSDVGDRMGGLMLVAACVALLGLGMILISKANAAPRPSKPLCSVFSSMSRSCTSVKAVVRMLGQTRAESLARACGATDYDIEQAKECLQNK